jgi:hypothetical protein
MVCDKTSRDTTPSELRRSRKAMTPPQGFKANPGLQLANTFGVFETSSRSNRFPVLYLNENPKFYFTETLPGKGAHS